MDRENFIARYPFVYHLANAANWESIQQHGLLSSESLCKQVLKLSDDNTLRITASHRGIAEHVRGIIFRDQRPMNEPKLTSCLQSSGLTPAEWYAILNERVFFWATRDRLERFISVYSGEPKCILHIDTRKLVERYEAQIELCHLNSGATRMPNHYRSRASFTPIAQFEFSANHRPAEVTVIGGVPDILDLCVDVSD